MRRLILAALAAAGAIALTAGPAAADGPFEPNDEVGTSAPITYSGSLTAAFESAQDRDNFSFGVLDSYGPITIAVANTTPCTRPDGCAVYAKLLTNLGETFTDPAKDVTGFLGRIKAGQEVSRTFTLPKASYVVLLFTEEQGSTYRLSVSGLPSPPPPPPPGCGQPGAAPCPPPPPPPCGTPGAESCPEPPCGTPGGPQCPRPQGDDDSKTTCADRAKELADADAESATRAAEEARARRAVQRAAKGSAQRALAMAELVQAKAKLKSAQEAVGKARGELVENRCACELVSRDSSFAAAALKQAKAAYAKAKRRAARARGKQRRKLVREMKARKREYQSARKVAAALAEQGRANKCST